MTAMTTHVLDLQEASAYLRLRRRTLMRLAAKGTVPALKIGKQWRFRRDALDELFGEAAALAGPEPRRGSDGHARSSSPPLAAVGEGFE